MHTATNRTAVGMTYSRDAETSKSSSTIGQAPKMGSPDDVSEDVDRQSMEKIPELLNWLIVRCTHVPVRIGQSWADCNIFHTNVAGGGVPSGALQGPSLGRLPTIVRANPATSAPSHICETWRNVAQTCLIIKEMEPERSRINVSDPI